MKVILMILSALSLSACANTRTVYRIDNVNGQWHYSRVAPKPDAKGDYHFTDLDGNDFTIKKRAFKSMQPYTYTVRL